MTEQTVGSITDLTGNEKYLQLLESENKTLRERIKELETRLAYIQRSEQSGAQILNEGVRY